MTFALGESVAKHINIISTCGKRKKVKYLRQIKYTNSLKSAIMLASLQPDTRCLITKLLRPLRTKTDNSPFPAEFYRMSTLTQHDLFLIRLLASILNYNLIMKCTAISKLIIHRSVVQCRLSVLHVRSLKLTHECSNVLI